MKRSLLALALLAPALALFTGCSTDYDHGAYLPVATTVNDVEDSAGFVLLDRAAQYSLTCPAIQETHLPDGRLQVIANVRNRENRRLQVQVNCVFKDAQGFSVEETPFQNLFLDENAQESVRFISMNNQPVRYTIRIRQAR
jgi:hypothetical protein